MFGFMKCGSADRRIVSVSDSRRQVAAAPARQRSMERHLFSGESNGTPDDMDDVSKSPDCTPPSYWATAGSLHGRGICCPSDSSHTSVKPPLSATVLAMQISFSADRCLYQRDNVDHSGA